MSNTIRYIIITQNFNDYFCTKCHQIPKIKIESSDNIVFDCQCSITRKSLSQLNKVNNEKNEFTNSFQISAEKTHRIMKTDILKRIKTKCQNKNCRGSRIYYCSLCKKHFCIECGENHKNLGSEHGLEEIKKINTAKEKEYENSLNDISLKIQHLQKNGKYFLDSMREALKKENQNFMKSVKKYNSLYQLFQNLFNSYLQNKNKCEYNIVQNLVQNESFFNKMNEEIESTFPKILFNVSNINKQLTEEIYSKISTGFSFQIPNFEKNVLEKKEILKQSCFNLDDSIYIKDEEGYGKIRSKDYFQDFLNEKIHNHKKCKSISYSEKIRKNTV